MLLLVDVNGNYTVDLALESMRRIAPYGIHLYEEPLPPQDFRGYELLCARAPLPVATGEALYTVWDFARLIEARAVDVVQPDLTLCGGLDQAKAIALLCQLHNLRFSPHVWGSGVGLAAAVHLVAALPGYPAHRPPARPSPDRVRRRRQPAARRAPDQPLKPGNGRIAVPGRPRPRHRARPRGDQALPGMSDAVVLAPIGRWRKLPVMVERSCWTR